MAKLFFFGPLGTREEEAVGEMAGEKEGEVQREVGTTAEATECSNDATVVLSLTSTSATNLSLDKTSEHLMASSTQQSMAPPGPSVPTTPKGKRSTRTDSRNSRANAGSLTQRSMTDSRPKFPSSWTPAWFEACARSGILPDDLLERPVEYFCTPGATDNIIAMRREHYEQRRKERLDVVSAAFLEAESSGGGSKSSEPVGSGTLQTCQEGATPAEISHDSTLGVQMSPEERRKLGMRRRMQEMKEVAERAAMLEVERKKAKQAQQLQAALSAENVRQEKLQAMERKKQLQREKEALRQQEHARQVALAKEREEEIQVPCCNIYVAMIEQLLHRVHIVSKL